LRSEPQIILPCRPVICKQNITSTENVQMEFIDHNVFYIAYLAPVGEGQHSVH